jgi:preprotein translocase subunit SecE
MSVELYKPGQGMAARWTAGGLLALMALFGAHSLYVTLETHEWWIKSLAQIPWVELDVTVGFVASAAVFMLACALIFVFAMNRAKSADFLIEVDSELRKVSWPPKREYVGSSVVVIVSVVVLGLFLFFVDVLFRRLAIIVGI